jgi:hypothetical protein
VVLSQRQERFWRWRLRSPVCAVADTIAVAAGCVLWATAVLDCVATWPANGVLFSDHDLSRLAGALVPACWLWFLMPLVFVGLGRTSRSSQRRLSLSASWRWRDWPMRAQWAPSGATAKPLLPPPVKACLVAAALASVAVIVVSFAIGVAKGSVQVLPGPVYLVSTLDLNSATPTRVSAAQFGLWQARFVREDSLFTLFGLVMVSAAACLLALRRQPARLGL